MGRSRIVGRYTCQDAVELVRGCRLAIHGGRKTSQVGGQGLAIKAGSGLYHQGRGCAVKAMTAGN